MQDPANELPRIPLLRTPVNRTLPESLSRDEVIMEVLGSAGSSRKGGPMALIRLEWHEHPAPPQHEMRQKRVLDSEDRFCLLYTSPSPRDRQKSRMPSSA